MVDQERPVVIANVDDNEIARYARSRILKRAGFEVIEAASGSEALDVIASHRPDLVTLDIHLPDMSGIDVCRRLKATPEHSSIIVLQISATADVVPSATSALNNGADGYLMEPIDADVLVATVRALLRLRKAERDLAAANEDLRRSNDDLQHFAFVASHDLQEPLRMITLFAQLLGRSLSGRLSETEDSYLNEMVGGVDRMRRLIDDLLGYSQAGRDRSQLTDVVNLSDAIERATELLGSQIAETRAKIEVGSLPSTRGELGQLTQVFQNLIGNALKYKSSERDPNVVISAAPHSGSHWVIRIQDNGIGIPPEFSELVFTPFKRLHGREIPGTGIGLALCRRIIEAIGGRIWLESPQTGGTAFCFTLPVAQWK